ncbi:MAG: ferritin family protein [Rhodospirillales bacterium]|nr:ferritin family protein [Rhodospirillales bacterium]
MNAEENEATPTDYGEFSRLEFLAHAYAIEREAEERYIELADQMETHNNPAVAEIFRKLARVEGLHALQILDQAGDRELPHIPPWEYRWRGTESPEAIDAADIHYLMTPHHALGLALKAEERALRFFSAVAASQKDAEVRKLAEEFAEDEREHVRLVKEWLVKIPEPAEDWAEDPDPSASQE